MELKARAPYNIHNKLDARSEFKKLMDEADDPASVNACPFFCGPEELDTLGYCQHLLGFCEPKRGAKLTDGEVRNPQGQTVEVLSAPDPVLRRRSIIRDKSLPLEVGDVLVRITSSFRVYRRNFTPPPAPTSVGSVTPQMAAIIAAEVSKALALKALEAATGKTIEAVTTQPPARPDPVTAPPDGPPTPTPQGPNKAVHPSIPPQVDIPGTTESRPPSEQPKTTEPPKPTEKPKK